MPYARSKSQGISMGLVILLVCVLVPTMAVGAVGTLWAFGKIDLPFLSRGNQIPEGYVRVLVSAGRFRPTPKFRVRTFLMPKSATSRRSPCHARPSPATCSPITARFAAA